MMGHKHNAQGDTETPYPMLCEFKKGGMFWHVDLGSKIGRAHFQAYKPGFCSLSLQSSAFQRPIPQSF